MQRREDSVAAALRQRENLFLRCGGGVRAVLKRCWGGMTMAWEWYDDCTLLDVLACVLVDAPVFVFVDELGFKLIYAIVLVPLHTYASEPQLRVRDFCLSLSELSEL